MVHFSAHAVACWGPWLTQPRVEGGGQLTGGGCHRDQMASGERAELLAQTFHLPCPALLPACSVTSRRSYPFCGPQAAPRRPWVP